jgi:hypothetical protein
VIPSTSMDAVLGDAFVYRLVFEPEHNRKAELVFGTDKRRAQSTSRRGCPVCRCPMSGLQPTGSPPMPLGPRFAIRDRGHQQGRFAPNGRSATHLRSGRHRRWLLAFVLVDPRHCGSRGHVWELANDL